jgi:HNH endonuclease
LAAAAKLVVFSYPKELHRRGPDPGPYSSYRRYKPHLRREFRGACIYCRLRDTLRHEDTFAVEHYLPKSKYPELETTWSNLFYACSTCNSRKHDYVAPPDSHKYFPNPADHRMFEHLRYVGAKVEAHSPTGEFALEELDLNEPDLLDYRQFYARLVSKTLDDVRELVEIVEAERLATATAPHGPPRDEAQRRLDLAAAELQEAEKALDYVLGPFR